MERPLLFHVVNSRDYSGIEYSVLEVPSRFGLPIEFSTQFTYLGGDLLLEYTHTPTNEDDLTAVVDAIESIESAQSQFAVGYNGELEGFDGFGLNFAPIVQFQVVVVVGDVNCDGKVDLLDVQPFVNALLNSQYVDKADINSDGVVDLLDVDGFVDLLLLG